VSLGREKDRKISLLLKQIPFACSYNQHFLNAHSGRHLTGYWNTNVEEIHACPLVPRLTQELDTVTTAQGIKSGNRDS
jgi:hypothetical protein